MHSFSLVFPLLFYHGCMLYCYLFNYICRPLLFVHDEITQYAILHRMYLSLLFELSNMNCQG